MNQTQSHSYSFGNSGHSRYASAHANSSAFSASANPNEDWTKVSDLAERRRIQNRIAQRNYRKKLKRRLEDLERRAGSSSTSPEQSHVELASPNLNSHTHPPPSKTTTTNRGLQGERRSPEPSLHFEREPLFGRQTPRQLSASPPPPFSYSSSMAGSSDYFCTEPESINYGFPSNSYAENASYQEQYYAGLLPTLSSSMPTPPHKESDPFGDEGLMNPFSMTYASVTGIDVPMAHGYMDFDPHHNRQLRLLIRPNHVKAHSKPSNADFRYQTPPLTDSYSFGDSRENSPTHLALPRTPFTLLESPRLSVYGTS